MLDAQAQPAPTLAETVSSEKHRLELFKQLTPLQQRVLLLSSPDDDKAVAASRCGASLETLDAWLYPSHVRHSPAFRALWFQRADPRNAIAYLERALEHQAPRRLEQAGRVADLLDQNPASLPPRVLATATSAALRLVELPLERRDKQQQQNGAQELLNRFMALIIQEREERAALPQARVVDVGGSVQGEGEAS